MRSARRTALAAALWLAAGVALGQATPDGADEDADPSRLKRLSLEELLEVEVTSVSRRGEPLSGAAAAVSVISGDDIRRFGATSLAEALRLADGLHVARFDSRTWAISARGFNITTANKMLVLIDGRSVYTPLFSGVFWDVQDTFLPDVERIEVIRGPGATLWGANAVNGVINILTKGAGATAGGLVTGGGGNEERAFLGVRYGGAAGGAADGAAGRGAWRVYGKAVDVDALAFPGGASARDPLRRAQGGFRSDWQLAGGAGLTVQGDVYQGRIGNAVLPDTDVDGGNLLGRWERRLAGGSQVQVQGYLDRTFRRVPLQFTEERVTADLDVQQRLRRGRHDLLWGAGYRLSADDVVNTAVTAWEPEDRTLHLWSAFLQDEFAWSERLRLIAGAKLEVNDFSGLEVQPTLRLAWTPSGRQTVWGAVSRAVRSPTRIDTDVRFPRGGVVVLQGNPDFASEDLLAWELGWRSRLRPGLTLDVALFDHLYDDLRSQEPPPPGQPPVPIVLGNRLEGEVRGVELAAVLDAAPWWRWHASYTYRDKELELEPGSRDPTGGFAEGNDPEQLASLRSSLDLGRAVELDVWLRYADPLPFPPAPAVTELDLRLGWRATPALELSLVGQNLLHDQHVQFRSAGAGTEEVERSVYGRVTWSF